MSIIKRMRFWLSSNMKSMLLGLRINFGQNKAKTEYTDLAPIDKIENGAEYLNALHWAVNKDKIKNIALAGPYGSGKSSIIDTYLNMHKTVSKKTLRISMATFVENVVDDNGNPKKIDIAPTEIELGILKQLFYKVDYRRIPQSRYRKLHKISFWRIFGCLLGLSGIISIIIYIFFPETFNSAIDKIIVAGSPIVLPTKLSIIEPSVISLILFGALALGTLAILSFMYRSILSRFRVKEIKLPVDATVKSGEETSETIFNKYMDEIVYFFEETKYQFVFFEDLDRLDDSSVFVHLREMNTLLNNYEAIKKPIVFVYAVKDDIFSDTDRTKFFEFIIPVIPIINSTNSGEILLKKLEYSNSIGIEHKIHQGFVLDISPYISDMRILLNTYNEFIVYKKTLREEQELNLLDEPMMALITFKNLYPRDFADIQMEQGIIKQAFSDKQKHLKLKQDTIQSKIDELTRLIDELPLETLKSIKELKITFLCEITDWRGAAYSITPSGRNYSTRASEFMRNDFNISQWSNLQRCSVNYNSWDGNSNSISCYKFSAICASYLKRAKSIEVIEENRIAEVQKKVEKLKSQLHDISSWSLKRLIEQFGSEEILSNEVQKNKLLVFLLRRGYIDEKYANYINYFKGNTVTKEDMNFILSVKNMESQPFNYNLTKTPMVVQRLQAYEFSQKSIYNFRLLEYMLSSADSIEKLNAFIKQLSDEDGRSWKFIDEFVDLTECQSSFIKFLASAWYNMWGFIVNIPVLTYERKIHYLALLISNVDIETLVSMNRNNEIKNFIEQNEDILQQLASIDSSKVIDVIEAAQVIFNRILVENVPEDVLDYIFDNNYYELNPLMINHLVEYKNKSLVHGLASKNYTTIIKLGYVPLIDYVRANLTQYIETIVLVEKHVVDEEEQILDLLRRSIDNQMLCTKIIEHENFCMSDITHCCNDLVTEKKTAVKGLWDALLKNDKIIPTWENVNRYWSVFKFTQNLLKYMESHTEDLVIADSQCIDDDFIRELISAEIDDGAFEKLLPSVRMGDFDITMDSVSEKRIFIMIKCKYFDFTAIRYEEINNLFPHLCIEFILQNQAEYVDVIDNIQMDSNLFENLLFCNRIEKKTTQILFDNYASQYMTSKIAANLHTLGLNINLEIFNAAWRCLDESGKQNLMLKHLELLDADSMHSCFTELDKWYSDFLDRSKQHSVEITDTPENQKLVERLKAVDYITSYQLKEKKEYDSVIEAERVKTIIYCRIKAIK